MDNKKISELMEVTELSKEAMTVVADNGVTAKCKMSVIAEAVSDVVSGRGTSIFYSSIAGSDVLHFIPYSVIQVPVGMIVKEGDVILCSNGSLCGVVGKTPQGIAVRHIGKSGETVASGSTSRNSMIMNSTMLGDEATSLIPYNTMTLLENASTYITGDMILCANGTLYHVLGSGSSGVHTNYIMQLGYAGTEGRGTTLHHSTVATSDTTIGSKGHFYSFTVPCENFGSPIDGDLILTTNGKLYLLTDASGYGAGHIYPTYLGTIY